MKVNIKLGPRAYGSKSYSGYAYCQGCGRVLRKEIFTCGVTGAPYNEPAARAILEENLREEKINYCPECGLCLSE